MMSSTKQGDTNTDSHSNNNLSAWRKVAQRCNRRRTKNIHQEATINQETTINHRCQFNLKENGTFPIYKSKSTNPTTLSQE